MISKKILTIIIPKWLKNLVKQKIESFKRPKMIWGFRNIDGNFHKRTRISDNVFFYHKERINIADKVFVWHYTILDGIGGLEIGEGSQIGAWVGIFTHTTHIAIRLYSGESWFKINEYEKKGYPIAPVKIGRYVFIGARSIISPGVTIGDGSIVGAGSLVIKNIPPYSIVVGSPAKIVGNTKELDKRYLTKEIEKYYYEPSE